MRIYRECHIKTGELLNFMHNNYEKDINNKDCQYIISEFDGNKDGFIQYNEFLNIFLPATNPAVRQYTCGGYRIIDKYHGPIPACVITLAVRILELEKLLGRKRILF